MLLKPILIGHDVVGGADVVLSQLIVESLSRDLDADSKHYLSVDHVFLESCVQDAKVAFAGFLYRVVLLLVSAHDFVQMNFIIEEIIKL